MSEKPVEVQLGELLRSRRLTLATAESCTGGLIGHMITNVPGSSDYFLGGVVSYANKTKVELLGVLWKTLEAHGAISRETVLEMAVGARERLGADIGLAVSGIAGPGGGVPNKPVGTTWIGLCAADQEQSWAFVFSGVRREVKEQAAKTAIRLAVEYLSPGSGISISTEESKQPEAPFAEIEVKAQLDSKGFLLPQIIYWKGADIPIASYGRRWEAEDGYHLLIMDYQARVYELIYMQDKNKWYLYKPVKLRKEI